MSTMGLLSKEEGYNPVEDNDEETHWISRYDKRSVSIWTLFLCLIFAIGLNVVLLSVIAIEKLQPGNNDFWSQMDGIGSSTVVINGTVWPPAHPSDSRLPPGPASDAYWKLMAGNRWVSLSREDVIKTGRDPTTIVQWPEGWPLTAGTYVGALDTFHKLHCLDELRMAAFKDYPNNQWTKRVRTGMGWVHLRHCVDLLAQDLKCNANLDVITYDWRDSSPNPWADFSINRKCTNWDQFMELSNRISAIDYFDGSRPVWHKPTGIVPLPMEPGYYEMFGFEDSELYPSGNGYTKPIDY